MKTKKKNKVKTYTRTDYAKYYFHGCENFEDMMNRALELAQDFKKLKDNGVKGDFEDGAYFFFTLNTDNKKLVEELGFEEEREGEC